MRDGKIVQSGQPEDLVGAPVDDYVRDFVQDVPKAQVLSLRWVMRDPRPDDDLDGPEFPPTAIIRSAVHAATETDKPIRVVDDGQLLGVVDRADILASIAGTEADARTTSKLAAEAMAAEAVATEASEV
jgi:glycine betaine/proline transport system ATP-binding protein